ncbi:saccharopine dehydrogenase [Pilobolus umbonatus]|nr:saccharopine dehydrogenase [Pilobolus umbonatus]
MTGSEKLYDLTVFGATGLTGKQIVRHIFELFRDHPEFYPAGFHWAIAGRNEATMEKIIDEMTDYFPSGLKFKPAIVIADVTKKESLDSMAGHSKIVINAVGPFRFLGEYVVRACVENKCDYVDVTGEPEFVERMQRTYQDKAVKNNVTIVHSCGFDSVPTDMGVLYVKNLFAQNKWTLSQIEMYLRLHTGNSGTRVGFATFESAVHGFGSAELLREIRKASTLAKLPPPQGRKLKFHKQATKDEEFGYHVPFIFADPSIVRLSQQIFLSGLAEPNTKKPGVSIPPPTQFAAYILLPSFYIVILYYIMGAIFTFLASSPWGRNLLLSNPEKFSGGLCSKEHPTQTQLNETSFEIILRAKGYDQSVTPDASIEPNVTEKVVVRGPEAGYVSTPRLVLQCALSVLNNKKLGYIPNGVLTPSTTFWETDLIERLRYVGITYDISR